MANNTLLTGAAVAVVLVLAVAGICIGIFNGLVFADQNVNEKWAQVETQYQRRLDLIPNLVNVVQGVSDFEQETLVKLSELRTQWQTNPSQNARVETANEIESTISKLLFVAENYPQLQATQAYRDLLVELEGTENRVAFARGEYNTAVRDYNVKTKSFPGNIFAGMFGFSEREFFESPIGAENPPVVDFE